MPVLSPSGNTMNQTYPGGVTTLFGQDISVSRQRTDARDYFRKCYNNFNEELITARMVTPQGCLLRSATVL